jgi:hypothetical protein
MKDRSYLINLAKRMCAPAGMNDSNAATKMAIFDAAQEEYDNLTSEEQIIVNNLIDEIL